MTFGTDQNRHLRKTFGKSLSPDMPQNVAIFIGDRMQCVKKPTDSKTVQAYCQDHILGPVKKILDGQFQYLYQLFDQKTCPTKQLFVYHKRGTKTTPMEVPLEENGGPLLIQPQGYLPQQWDRVIANREMTRREVYPLYYRALIEMYTPPLGKCVIVDGVPDHPLLPEEYVEGVSLNRAYFSKTYSDDADVTAGQLGAAGLEFVNGNIFATPRHVERRMQTCRKQCPPEEYSHGCAEADLSAFFYVNKHFRHATKPGQKTDDILLDTNDGDTIMIALLHSRDRIDPRTGRFINCVYVKMRGNAASKKAEARRKAASEAKGEEHVPDVINGEDVYVNINVLYMEMDRHPSLRKAAYPVLIAVTLYIFSGTDFFGDFAGDDYSLFYFLNWEKHVWDTWCSKADRFRNMVMMFYAGETTFNQPELLRRVYIDEQCMVTFFYQCYSAKYAADIRAHYGDPDIQITPAMIEEYTGSFAENLKRKKDEPDDKWEKRLNMAKRKRCPPKSILRRYARLLKGNILYWINDYRPNGGHTMFDPLEMYNGFPYYGFVLDPADPAGKRYLLSPICSEPMPVPEFVVPHLGRDRAPPKKKPSSSAVANATQEPKGPKRERSRVILTKTGQLTIAPVDSDTPPPAVAAGEESDPFSQAASGVAPKKKPGLTQAERIRMQTEREAGKKPPKKLPKLSSSDQAPIKFEAAKMHGQTLKMPGAPLSQKK